MLFQDNVFTIISPPIEGAHWDCFYISFRDAIFVEKEKSHTPLDLLKL